MKLIFSAFMFTLAASGSVMGQSAQDGEQVFRKCTACHKVGPGAKNRTGPVLTGVVGRPAGTYEDFKYSKSMLAAGAAGLVWTEENIFDYIVDPSAFLRIFLDDPKAKAKMTFKLKGEADRQNVIAYLATFETAAVEIPQNGFCIVNASQSEHLFATETREGARQVVSLKPGGRLCADITAATDGIVTVYENAEGFEGCSRIIPVGSSEGMLKFAESGRCGWSSHNS